jgi:hypothetical protein
MPIETPFSRAADILNQRKKATDDASETKPAVKTDDKMVKASPDPSRDPAEMKELSTSASRLRDYRIKKNIGGSTDAEARLYKLQTKSYKKGTKRVPKSGVAKLHKGEAVLNKKQAKKFRASKGSARLLGAGKMKVIARKSAKKAGYKRG